LKGQVWKAIRDKEKKSQSLAGHTLITIIKGMLWW
jgi:hypothetical protein